MSEESSWDVQSAVFSRLTASENLCALLAEGATSIKDYVPPNSLYPYLVIGETRSKPLECGATEVILTLHSYSNASGMNELRQILAAVYDTLNDKDFAVPNQDLILCLEQSAEARIESDGKTRHGIQQFQIITEVQ